MNNYEFCAHFASVLCKDKKATILDYGCGAGHIVRLLRDGGYEAFGCDIFYQGGDRRDLVPKQLLEQDIIREMPEAKIPFPASAFDLVTNNQVLEHVESLDDVLQEIHRVLKPGGLVLSLFPDRGVWREGHCGIPLLHRFPKRSQSRVWYAIALRSLGLGYNKGQKGRVQWSRDYCDYMDRWTHYRSYSEIRDSFGRLFCDFTHHESYWLDIRYGARLEVIKAIPAPIKSGFVRKFGGVIVTARKKEPICSGGRHSQGQRT